jgi:hypothetical protein
MGPHPASHRRFWSVDFDSLFPPSPHAQNGDEHIVQCQGPRRKPGERMPARGAFRWYSPFLPLILTPSSLITPLILYTSFTTTPFFQAVQQRALVRSHNSLPPPILPSHSLPPPPPPPPPPPFVPFLLCFLPLCSSFTLSSFFLPSPFVQPLCCCHCEQETSLVNAQRCGICLYISTCINIYVCASMMCPSACLSMYVCTHTQITHTYPPPPPPSSSPSSCLSTPFDPSILRSFDPAILPSPPILSSPASVLPFFFFALSFKCAFK